MRRYGQTFTTEILERIRAVVSAEDGLSRSALSRRVCGWLGWHDAAGKPKEVSSRKALVESERRGVISLPAARCPAPQAREAAMPEPFVGPLFSGSLEALGGIELVAVDDADLSALWRRMLASHHPQGGGRLCGAQQRYLIRSPVVGWLGALGFSAAAWQLAARDTWIGWCTHARRAQLGRVVANSRFVLLPSIEVFHRTLKSGCRIEDRRCGSAEGLQACLAIDLVVAWRVMWLSKRGPRPQVCPARCASSRRNGPALASLPLTQPA